MDILQNSVVFVVFVVATFIVIKVIGSEKARIKVITGIAQKVFWKVEKLSKDTESSKRDLFTNLFSEFWEDATGSKPDNKILLFAYSIVEDIVTEQNLRKGGNK